MVPTRVTEVHISSTSVPYARPPCRHWEEVFLRYCAPQKDQSGSAADWRPPKSGDREDDGRVPSDRGNRPRERES